MKYATEAQKANIHAFLTRHGFYYCHTSKSGKERWENENRYVVNVSEFRKDF